MFYGNKTSSVLTQFSSSSPNKELEGLLDIDVQDMSSTVDAGAQVQQVINIDCKNVFHNPPELHIKLKWVD